MTRGATGAANERSETLEVYLSVLTVGLIATPRTELESCDISEQLASVVERNNQRNKFDFMPVTGPEGSEAHGKIKGLIELTQITEPLEAGVLVRDHMQPLSEEHLIGADASILKFVSDADQRRCRLIVSGDQINGLISLSDLQKLPVRAALFGMITHLEMLMMDVIRSEFGGSTDWMTRLNGTRRERTQGKFDTAKRDDTFVDDELLFTEFCDKVTIIKKHNKFPWNGPNEFESELNRVQKLRDNLAHANDYAATREAAAKVCETVRLTLTWIKRLGDYLNTLAEPP